MSDTRPAHDGLPAGGPSSDGTTAGGPSADRRLAIGQVSGDAARLRLAVVGPSHPLKGGVAAHTTMLAHELAEAGHDVSLVSWSHLYPTVLYPGEQAVPDGTPDVPPFPHTTRSLSWARPDTWVRAGLGLRAMDAILVVHVIPPVAPALLTLLRSGGALRSPDGALRGPDGALPSAGGPRSIVIAHNVLPHEPRPGDRTLVRALLRRVDAVIVHSADQARLASELGAGRVHELELPPHLPGGDRRPHVPGSGRTRLLSLGIVRDYKGVDLLLDAACEVPEVEVTVAGELWGEAGRHVEALARDPRLRGRVEVQSGYVPSDRIADLMAHHDVVALTYRTATASQNVLLAHRHGLPVLATDVGTFGRQVVDGVDGLLVPAGDRDALVAALRRLADPTNAARLRAAVRPPDLGGPWAEYVGGVEALAATAGPRPDGGDGRSGAAAGRAGRLVAGIRAKASGHQVLDLRSADFPEWVRATDVLALDSDAIAARALARRVGLPRCRDAVAAWAALGALAAILRIRGDARGGSVVVEESGPRSPLSRWTRAVGFAPVELSLTHARRPGGRSGVDPASLDVITRVHPGGCSASDVDDVLDRASRTLRRGGLLVITLPVGDGDPTWSVSPADVRGVLARAGDAGLALVGDVDGDITDRMRRAARVARDTRAARDAAVVRDTGVAGDTVLARDAAVARDTVAAALEHRAVGPRERRPAEDADPAFGIIRLTFRRR